MRKTFIAIATAAVLLPGGAWASCCRHHPRAHWYYQGYHRQDIYRYGPLENGGYRSGYYGGRYHDETKYND
jgi:hypothetical protein